MAAEDYYSFAARTRLQQISADRAQALADLEFAKAHGGDPTEGVQRLADLAAQARNVVALHDEYVRSQQAPEVPEVSAEEKFARRGIK